MRQLLISAIMAVLLAGCVTISEIERETFVRANAERTCRDAGLRQRSETYRLCLVIASFHYEQKLGQVIDQQAQAGGYIDLIRALLKS
jgi:hypothetical protein